MSTNTETVEHRGRKPVTIPKGVKIDWSQTNREIGEQLGCSLMTVMSLRRSLGKKPLPRGRPREVVDGIPKTALKSTFSQLKDMKKNFDKMYSEFSKRFVESQ